MNYLVIINSDAITCATNNYLLSDKEVIRLDSISDVVETINTLKAQKEEQINISIKNGYKNGFNQGLVNAQNELNTQFIEYLKDLTENYFVNTTETDSEIINMACEVTRKIADEIDSAEILPSLAITALKKLKQHKRIELKVRPEYVEILRSKISSLETNEVNNYSSLEIVADESLDTLDCIIKTDAGVTVASFTDQLNLLKENIINEMRE